MSGKDDVIPFYFEGTVVLLSAGDVFVWWSKDVIPCPGPTHSHQTCSVEIAIYLHMSSLGEYPVCLGNSAKETAGGGMQ